MLCAALSLKRVRATMYAREPGKLLLPIVFQNLPNFLMKDFAPGKCLLSRAFEDPKNLLTMCLGRLQIYAWGMRSEILRKNAIKKHFHANFPEYWVKCWKSFRSQLALIRTAASNGLFNQPSLAWKANATAQTEQVQEASCG